MPNRRVVQQALVGRSWLEILAVIKAIGENRKDVGDETDSILASRNTNGLANVGRAERVPDACRRPLQRSLQQSNGLV